MRSRPDPLPEWSFTTSAHPAHHGATEPLLQANLHAAHGAASAGAGVRFPASEKLEIIRLVERSHLPVRRTLDKLGIPSTTFYRRYELYRAFAEAGLEDRTSGPGRVWNRIPDDVRRQIVDLALDEPELSPRELAVTFTDTRGYFVSEASVYSPHRFFVVFKLST